MRTTPPIDLPRDLAQPGFCRVFAPGKLTIGFILPIEAYPSGPTPTLQGHARVARKADEMGYAALWARDVALLDPSFGDAGQVLDAFTYLGYLSAVTSRIALCTGSAVITLRHPLHLAKAASSVDVLSGGRMLLGVASGDRPVEYPAFGLEEEFQTRGERFREAFEFFRVATESAYPSATFPKFGSLDGTVDLIPKPAFQRIPMLVTGQSRQPLEWIAKNSDGWFYYFMEAEQTAGLTRAWREAVERECGSSLFKPFAQGLFFDLDPDPNAPPRRIHSGLRVGRNALIGHLSKLQASGVHHLALNLKASRRPALEVLEELSEFVLPLFPSHHPAPGAVALDRACARKTSESQSANTRSFGET